MVADLAPEIVSGEAYGTKSDIWSLGCALYQMLTLELPFKATSLPELARLIVEQVATRPDLR